jgi:large subunit ribosomal protein L10
LAITRQKKEELLEEYKEQINTATAIVFTNYRGKSVAQLRSLRSKLGENGTAYVVIKNSIFGIALEQLGNERPEELLTGPNAVAFVGEDIGRGVTALMDWIKAERIGEIQGALLGGSMLDAKRAESLADLPTREETLSLVLGAINAPASNLARMLTAPSSSLVRVINAHVEKQQQEGAA